MLSNKNVLLSRHTILTQHFLRTAQALVLSVFLGFGSLNGAYAADAPTVNINTADAATLAEVLVGVGDDKAKAIIESRETHGKFASSQDLTRVKGIGTVIVAKNSDRIVLK